MYQSYLNSFVHYCNYVYAMRHETRDYFNSQYNFISVLLYLFSPFINIIQIHLFIIVIVCMLQ